MELGHRAGVPARPAHRRGPGADDASTAAVGRAAANQRKAEALRTQAQRAVRRLTDRLREAEAAQARLTRLQPPRSSAPKATAARPVASGVACLMESPPSSSVDAWGASRAGGRGHQARRDGPDRAEVDASTAGAVSRVSTSTNGGLQLDLQGDHGVEYFYAASPATPSLRAPGTGRSTVADLVRYP